MSVDDPRRDVTRWTAEMLPELAEELEIDLGPVIDFLKAGGKIEPFNVTSATFEERMRYYQWMEGAFSKMAEADRRLFESAIIRCSVMAQQDKDPTYEIPNCLKDAFDDSSAIDGSCQKLLNMAGEMDEKDPQGAVALLKEALGMLEEGNPQHGEVVAAIHYMMGMTLSEEANKPDEALPRFNKAIEIKKKLGDADSPSMIYHLIGRGGAYRKQRKYNEALEDHERAEKLAKAHGTKKQKAKAAMHLAATYCCLREMDKALELAERIQSLTKRPDGHVTLTNAEAAILEGLIMVTKQEWEEALDCFKLAWPVVARSYPKTHKRVKFLSKQGSVAYKKVMAMNKDNPERKEAPPKKQRKAPPPPPKKDEPPPPPPEPTAGDLLKDAARLKGKGDNKGAIELLLKAYEMMGRAGDERTIECAMAVDELSKLYFQENDVDQAFKYGREAAELLSHVLGDDLKTAAAHANVSSIARKLGKLDESEDAMRSALQIMRAKLKPSSKELYKRELGLAVLLSSMGKKEEAADQFDRVLTMAEKIYGDAHAETLKVKKRLSELRPESKHPQYIVWYHNRFSNMRVCTEKTDETSDDMPVYKYIEGSKYKLFIKKSMGTWRLCTANGAFYQKANGDSPLTAAWKDADVYVPKKANWDALWHDPDFPHSTASLGQKMPTSWVPVQHIMKGAPLFDQIDPCDMQQGSLGDCWLIAAMSSVAEFPQALRNVFTVGDIPSNGKIPLRMYNRIKEDWVTMEIDCFIPCSPQKWWRKGGDPHFVKSGGKGGECWPMLVEKAFAKLSGGYKNLVGGNSTMAWHTLMGGEQDMLKGYMKNGKDLREWTLVVKNIPLDRWSGSYTASGAPKVHKKADFWKHLQHLDNKRCLMSASLSGGHEDELTNGLVTSHAYSVLKTYEGNGQQLVQVRNPWGNAKEWNGAWSDKSNKWAQHPEVAKAVKFSAKDDGSFWMPYSDFFDLFGTIGAYQGSMPGAKASDNSSGVSNRNRPTPVTFMPPPPSKEALALEEEDDTEQYGKVLWRLPVSSAGCVHELRMHQSEDPEDDFTARTLIFSLSFDANPKDLEPHKSTLVELLLGQDVSSEKKPVERKAMALDIVDSVVGAQPGQEKVLSTTAYGKKEQVSKDAEGHERLPDMRLTVLLRNEPPEPYGADEEGEEPLPEVTVDDEEVFDVVDEIEGEDDIDGGLAADIGADAKMSSVEKAENQLSLGARAPKKTLPSVGKAGGDSSCCCTLM
uniref:Calpain catalytic domain-containing protein n=1 Tax=Chromera velia CCMP2878 TaxID=1169474 RepID=A0A0G4HPH2_9ALVE|eukprot:Cvel_7770.t1-p1 / transcript=Cvel_7770.t1 / gene=Cvel_7770 / organism=Chromera_velia_CCMP2878 / gene_product=Calpain, putative / transcript_product=Calpain, putative / location=Cvel_scaffold414:14715-20500(+) / protein_length=1234 / sequence_SO=supercontig / SO=protein_coding / is_pseudo=false